MKNRFIFVVVVLVLFLSATNTMFAQRGHHPKFRNASRSTLKSSEKFSIVLGAGIAVMNSDNRGHDFGDNGLKPISNNGFGPELSVGAIYQFTPSVGVQGNIDYFSLDGDEMNDPRRDVSFNSSGVEVSGSVIVNLINSHVRGRGPYASRQRRGFVPYAKAGLGLISYKASSESNEMTFPATTDYPAVAAVIPVGLGVKVYYSKRITFAPEINMHFTSSDYLDNMVVEGGYTGDNDHYLTTSVKMIYTPGKRKYRISK
ncbi:outer membrane beta-barrel protein [Pontibacter cellulosilyticus]|uniref:Outer membrane beta-barrel protein n=1 Tax=Pontibacter cellulosilyticus TaxID=1720253 RepID=A0A923N5F2_9BACT|nr:outer membrane beta-barrel protein [Pontibacter cellulosilyticus]MBC5992538.1 outer membrane beta-barrel protein [Pontibacter cellulosilyticus]